jgi:hypothetical protein
MNRNLSLFALAWLSVAVVGCHSHKEMQYSPEKYAKLRGIELITTSPTRPYELVATVEGFGGKFTAKETMINGMIDKAQASGARALIPMEFSGEGHHAGQTKPVAGLELFVYTENGRTVTKGRAISWIGN